MEAITREEKLMDGQYVEPITREEKILAGEDLETVTRREYFLKKYRGGGGDISVVQLSVNENGTYTAPSGKAYSPVNVEVPTPENAYFLKSVAGLPSEIASFSDGASMPMKELEVSIEPIQSGSGEPSPSNVRPISGWTACNVSVCGTNLIDASAVKVGYIYNRTQMAYQESANWVSTDYIPVIAGKSYKFTYNNGTNGVISQLQGINKDKTSAEQLSASSGGFTVPQGIAYVIICTNNTSTKDNVATWQLEIGTTGSTYKSYTGNNITTIQFTDGTNPLTVYGGTLDVTSGVLTVTYKGIDLGDLTWTAGSDATGQYFSAPLSPNAKKKTGSALGNNMSDIYPISPSTNVVDKSLAVNNNGNVVYVRDTSYETAIAFDTGMSGHQLVYELETPQTYSLNPTAVASILGQNNVFADTGEVNEVQYLSKEV